MKFIVLNDYIIQPKNITYISPNSITQSDTPQYTLTIHFSGNTDSLTFNYPTKQALKNDLQSILLPATHDNFSEIMAAIDIL